jgi:hypothetical protein
MSILGYATGTAAGVGGGLLGRSARHEAAIGIPRLAGLVNVLASFVLCGSPVVAQAAIPTRGAARVGGIAFRHWDFMPLWPD